MNGWIDLWRHRFFSEQEGSDSPMDRLVDETESAVSVGVRQLCVREGGHARSFARGRENLKEVGQIEIGEELLRQLVEKEGKAVLKASESEQLELDWSASQCVVQTPQGQETTRIYVSGDGVMVPTTTQQEKDKHREKVMEKRSKLPREQQRELKHLGPVKKGTDQRYKQMYVTCFYDQSQDHRLVGVTRKQVKGLKHLLRREAARVRLRGAVERVGAVDGAVCLRHNLDELPLEEVLLDFYHLSEHVGQAAAGMLGQDSQTCKTWLADVLHTLRHEGYEPFYQKLMDKRGGLRGHKRQAADQLIKYVVPRAEMILYELCDRRGWDVGSGPMESMCGVTTDRLKGRGRRWDLDNAEAMMALEGLYQSTGLWDRHWANALAHRN